MTNTGAVSAGFLSIFMGFAMSFMHIGGRKTMIRTRGTSITGNPTFVLIAFGIVNILTGSILP